MMSECHKNLPPSTGEAPDISGYQESIKFKGESSVLLVEDSVPGSISEHNMDWSKLKRAVNASLLKFSGADRCCMGSSHKVNPSESRDSTRVSSHCSVHGQRTKEISSFYVEVSSGGTVFFCFLESAERGSGELCVVLKFISDRLLCQSEQFAAEITNHLGIDCPKSRIIQYNDDNDSEWQIIQNAATARGSSCSELLCCMERNLSLLLLEYVPGAPFNTSPDAVGGSEIINSSHTLGKILGLDMILGNADRLACDRLGWPGNPSNLIYGTNGRLAGKIVCIDAVVQRKPPHNLTTAEDAACEELAELAFNKVDFVFDLLENALFANSQFQFDQGHIHVSMEAAKACQRGMIETFEKAMGLRGIFEMLHQKIEDWIGEFVEDMEHDIPAESHSLSPRDGKERTTTPRRWTLQSKTSLMTSKIKMIQKEAGRDEVLNLKLEMWNSALGEKCTELQAALNEWQARSKSGPLETTPSKGNGMGLTTAFLNANVRPVVDLYELKLRLQHVLRRLSILGQALSSAHPSKLFPNLYISGAVAANSFHVLRNLEITHVLNATEDLFPPGDPRSEYISENFKSVLRIPLRDEDDEDIEQYFPIAADFIDSMSENDKILIHCHAGKSRSCALVISYLILKKKYTLKEAINLVQQARPQAAPNASYINSLGYLEEKVHGKKTIKVRKTKPDPLICAVCGMAVGLSQKTLQVHMKSKHPD
jgi:hypothetical protein